MNRAAGRSLLAAAVFVGPFLILYVFLLIYPLIDGLVLSFNRADPFGSRRFIGLENYTRLFADQVFLQALANTFKYTLIIVPILTVITLLLALALNRPGRAASIYRGIFFSSSVLSVTIVTLIWRFVLAPDAGFLGEVAQALGHDPIPFLSDPSLAVWSVAVATIWWSIGLPMMLFLAGLQQIPEDIYEAAALDGAGRWTTFWRVTLPSLRRTLVLVVMLQTAAQLQLFGQAHLLTGGGPGGASRPLVLFIYETAFGRWDLGYGSATAQVLFALILVATLFQYRAGTARGEA